MLGIERKGESSGGDKFYCLTRKWGVDWVHGEGKFSNLSSNNNKK